MKTFESVADMKAARLREGQLVQCKRYYAGGDLVDNLVYEIQTAGADNPPLVETLANGNFAVKLTSTTQTEKEQTYYVDPVSGVDAVGRGYTVGTPCRTIQYAWDLIPTVVRHQQTIQLADGTYNENNLPSAQNPRPAVLVGRGKVTTFRSTLNNGTNLTAAIVIQGNASDRTAVKIVTTSSLTYGIYINKGNIGIQNLSIESNGVNSANVLLTAHRTDSYAHVLNVLFDGKNTTTYGALTESSGQVEVANDCNIQNCSIGLATLTDGDNVVLSGSSTISNCGTGVLAKNGHAIISMTDGTLSSSTMIGSCTTGLVVTNGSAEVRGLSGSNRCVINSPVSLQNNSSALFVFTDIDSTINLTEGSSVKIDNCGFQNSITARASDVTLRTSNSYIDAGSPNNDAVSPVVLVEKSRIYYEGSNNIAGSSGGYVSYNPQDLTVNANNSGITLSVTADVFRVNGNGANRTGCFFGASNIEEGRMVHVYGDTWGVGLTSGTTMDIGADFTIGNGTGSYTGATFVFRSGKWRLTGRGQVRA